LYPKRFTFSVRGIGGIHMILISFLGETYLSYSYFGYKLQEKIVHDSKGPKKPLQRKIIL